MADTPAHDITARYLAADARRDTDALLVLFTNDAVVVDEGQTRRGASEIRAWRDYVTTAYDYTTEVRGIQPEGEDEYGAKVHPEGTFPGAPSTWCTTSRSRAAGSVD
jgi:ketosteroid isomerase-like protein